MIDDRLQFANNFRKRFPTINRRNSNNSLNGEGGVETLKEKGSKGINRASAEGFDSITTVPGQKIHQNCRQEYCRPKDTILKICSERSDEWSETISAWLMNVSDLAAADAGYR